MAESLERAAPRLTLQAGGDLGPSRCTAAASVPGCSGAAAAAAKMHPRTGHLSPSSPGRAHLVGEERLSYHRLWPHSPTAKRSPTMLTWFQSPFTTLSTYPKRVWAGSSVATWPWHIVQRLGERVLPNFNQLKTILTLTPKLCLSASGPGDQGINRKTCTADCTTVSIVT